MMECCNWPKFLSQS